ncbi:MAG: ethanolamine utilization protein EutN [Blastocatellia bacterium]|nr:ethanolamine utilization protein EutN [Blastocatellia bacterium]
MYRGISERWAVGGGQLSTFVRRLRFPVRFTFTKKMQLARVIGTVVATIKNESLAGRKLLVVQSLNKDLQPQGQPLVAVDSVGAGINELVFWCRGKEASFPFKRDDTPTDCTIVGIVDSDKHVDNGKRDRG